uniref:Uncharacterized protein n=1 Tax=Ranid herpesvirus 4 TaxID=2849006 RepID=A0A8F3HSJ1_9VIRU|nr:MAG: hypothetical protein [Ranid herpesvirus 4]
MLSILCVLFIAAFVEIKSQPLSNQTTLEPLRTTLEPLQEVSNPWFIICPVDIYGPRDNYYIPCLTNIDIFYMCFDRIAYRKISYSFYTTLFLDSYYHLGTDLIVNRNTVMSNMRTLTPKLFGMAARKVVVQDIGKMISLNITRAVPRGYTIPVGLAIKLPYPDVQILSLSVRKLLLNLHDTSTNVETSICSAPVTLQMFPRSSVLTTITITKYLRPCL